MKPKTPLSPVARRRMARAAARKAIAYIDAILRDRKREIMEVSISSDHDLIEFPGEFAMQVGSAGRLRFTITLDVVPAARKA